MKFAATLALVAGIVVADGFYLYAGAPGSLVDKYYVDMDTIDVSGLAVRYFYLTPNADQAEPGFRIVGSRSSSFTDPNGELIGVRDYLLSNAEMAGTETNGKIEVNYDFYACKGQDARFPLDAYVLYGWNKPSDSASSSNTEISQIYIPTDIDPNGGEISQVYIPTDVGVGVGVPSGDVGVGVGIPSDVAVEPIVTEDALIPAETVPGDALVTSQGVAPAQHLGKRDTVEFPADFAQCIRVNLYTTDSVSSADPVCTETPCESSPTCLTICKPCAATGSDIACPAVCIPMTVCVGDGPNNPSISTPDPNGPSTPTPDPKGPSTSSPDPKNPSKPTPDPKTGCTECTVVLPACSTCVKTVIDYVFTCPSATTITISTCPQVNVCSPTALVLPPGTHTVSGRAVVPATSGSFTVISSRSGTTGTSSRASGTGSRVSGSGTTGSLTGFNGAAGASSIFNSMLGAFVFLLMLW